MTPVMASLHLSSFHPQTQSLPLSPFPVRTAVLPPPSLCSYYHHQTHQLGFLLSKSPSGVVLRSSVVARLAPSGHHLPDFEAAAGELFGRLEGLVYTVADAAVSSADAAAESSKQNGDWLSGITNYMEAVLKVLKDGLSALHVPYSYGFAIILLTILVKAVTFPLTKKQVESAIAMRSMQPQVKTIQKRYAGNQEKIQLETARLYKLAGINPLAGCLPTLVTIPIWIGLYRALSNVANEGLLTEGFFWIPSLAGPTTIAARQSGSGISWLFPFVDGHPPLGWSETFAYLVLPVLLIISQYISAQIMQPQQDGDPSQKNAQAATKFLPLLIGYFSLSVPSGLSLYWLTNNILSTGQQIWLQKLGGAKNPVREFIDSIEDDSPASPRAVSNTQKSLVDAAKEKANPNVGEQVSSSGSRPGERFKQLKEQEAKRKKQREEERRKAREAEAVAHVVVEKQNEVKQVGTDVEQDLVDNHTKANSPSNNGGLNSKASSMENDGISPSNDKEKKEETTEMQDSGNRGISPISIDRKDQTAGRE